MRSPTAEIVVDLDAIRHNVRALARLTRTSVMMVVKADAYGHGMIPCASAAREVGAAWLGVATLDEALRLRAAGDRGPLLCWLAAPGEDYASAISAGIDVTAYTRDELAEIVTVAENQQSRRARVQLKVDTGLNRGGAAGQDWPGLVEAAAAAQRSGNLEVTGIWSHLACADDPEHPANDLQEAKYGEALELAAAAGLDPPIRHLANSAAALTRPSARLDLVRCGIAAYGLSPSPELVEATRRAGLRPAMTVRTRLALTKRLPAGASVSYGHTWTATAPTTVGLVPIGYAEGVPRQASSRAEVWMAGRRRPVLGRICMDQFVVDLGGDEPPAGTEILVMGPGTHGEPTAEDWAGACDTINYEIVTRWSGRMTRTYVNDRNPGYPVVDDAGLDDVAPGGSEDR
ncbi:MAG: alanine racemase [Nocardioides sp.]